jgi:hypothetical protein
MSILRLTVSSLSILLILVFSYGVSSAQPVLLVASSDSCIGAGGAGFSTLYIVNPETAASNPVGPIGFRGVSGLAVLGDGRLVGSAIADAGGDRISVLIEINPFNGQGSLIGTIGINNEGGCGRVPDLTYDDATDTLYGSGSRCVPGSGNGPTQLLRIDQTTGAGTIIGPTGQFSVGGNALAIRNDGTLFYSEGNGAVLNILTLNPLTGQGTIVASRAVNVLVYNSFDFSPVTGELFGIEFSLLANPPPPLLVTVDTSTAGSSAIGEVPACSDALVIFTIPQRNVPTLSEWGMIAAAVGLGLVGVFFAVRRSRRSSYNF